MEQAMSCRCNIRVLTAAGRLGLRRPETNKPTCRSRRARAILNKSLPVTAARCKELPAIGWGTPAPRHATITLRSPEPGLISRVLLVCRLDWERTGGGC